MSSDSRMPDPTLRGFLSLALVIHGFMVLIGVGADVTSAPIYRALHGQPENDVPGVPGLRPYLQTLGLDLGYAIRLTDAVPPEANSQEGEAHVVEVVLKHADGRTETATYPDESIWPRQRRQRYYSWANEIALRVGQTRDEAVLPNSLCQYLLRTSGAAEATLRCRRYPLEPPRPPQDGRVISLEPATVYEANAWVRDGKYDYLKVSSQRDVAPPDKVRPDKRP